MRYSRGEIVLVDFPYSDRTGSKVRPALVVQNDAQNQRITDTILVSISRSSHRASATQVLVEIRSAEGQQTGLRQDSMIQCENLVTFDQRLIVTRIGALPSSLLKRVDEALRVALDIH